MEVKVGMLPDKTFKVGSFVDMTIAVDEYIKYLENKIDITEYEKLLLEKLRKIQDALYEILAKANEFEKVKKEGYETLINIKVIPNQLLFMYTTEQMKRLV